MSNILFYLLFAILLYFVLSRVFEKFNLEQENFDPSLVPVSSIVTLAKVAQKLVNGNGVLTNPGSLQIGGSSGAPGNLRVTGTTTLDGRLTANNGVTINNNNTQGFLTIGTGNWINSNDNSYRLLFNDRGATTFGSYDGNYQWRGPNGTMTNPAGNNSTMTLDSTGNLMTTGNLNAGYSGFNTRIGQIWSQPGIYAEGTKDLEIGAGSMNVYIGAKNGGAVNNLNVTGTTTVGGDLTVNGKMTFGGTSANGFMWDNENNNGYACLRSATDSVGSATGGRLCFNKNHGIANFDSGGLSITGNLHVPGTGSFGGNLNAANMTIPGTLGVGGNSTIAGTLGVTGNLTVTGTSNICIGTTCISKSDLDAVKKLGNIDSLNKLIGGSRSFMLQRQTGAGDWCTKGSDGWVGCARATNSNGVWRMVESSDTVV